MAVPKIQVKSGQQIRQEQSRTLGPGSPTGGSGTQATRSAASILEGLTGGAGGTGGTSSTSGSGSGGGTAGASTSTYTGTAAVNPALAAQQEQWNTLLGKIEQQYGERAAKTADPTVLMKGLEAQTEGARKQAAVGMGQRGFGSGGGIGVAQQQGLVAEGLRGQQGALKEFENDSLARQDALTTALTQAQLGVGTGQAGTAAQIAANQLGANQLGQEAWKTQLQDATDRQRIAAQTSASQLAALLSLL